MLVVHYNATLSVAFPFFVRSVLASFCMTVVSLLHPQRHMAEQRLVFTVIETPASILRYLGVPVGLSDQLDQPSSAKTFLEAAQAINSAILAIVLVVASLEIRAAKLGLASGFGRCRAHLVTFGPKLDAPLGSVGIHSCALGQQ